MSAADADHGTIRIRDARLADAQAWHDIILEAAEEGDSILTTPEEVLTRVELGARMRALVAGERAMLVAERGGEVVGVLGMERGERPAARHTAAVGLTVRRDARGRGVGTALMHAAHERARAWGVRKMCLGVFSHNTGARKLYASLGYVEEGIRREMFLVGGVLRDEVIMAKEIP